MNAMTSMGRRPALLALALGVASTHAAETHAQREAVPASGPPLVREEVALPLPGLTWGLSTRLMTALVEKTIDDEYKPLYAKVSPGVKMKQLDASVAAEKAAFARSRVDFLAPPTALDSGALRREFTYGNQEAKMTFVRGRIGASYHFFFIQDRFWKLIEEKAVKESFADATIRMSRELGVAGRALPADAVAGRLMREVDWRDRTTHLRLIERESATIAIGYEEDATVARLHILRPTRPR